MGKTVIALGILLLLSAALDWMQLKEELEDMRQDEEHDESHEKDKEK